MEIYEIADVNLNVNFFYRKCGEHTPHFLFPYALANRQDKNSKKISQILYCENCDETILEIYTQIGTDLTTQQGKEQFPRIRDNFIKKIDNGNGAIDSEIYLNYSDCIDSFNQVLYKGSYLYLIITIELICNDQIKGLSTQRLYEKGLIPKLKFLSRKKEKYPLIGEFSDFFLNLNIRVVMT